MRPRRFISEGLPQADIDLDDVVARPPVERRRDIQAHGPYGAVVAGPHPGTPVEPLVPGLRQDGLIDAAPFQEGDEADGIVDLGAQLPAHVEGGDAAEGIAFEVERSRPLEAIAADRSAA